MSRMGFLKTLVIDGLFFNSLSLAFLKKIRHSNDSSIVFIYHLVSNNNYYEFLKSEQLAHLDADLFRKQLLWLLERGFSFLTINELSDRILNQEITSSKWIAITFDDGFKITAKNALPILQSLGIKATFFITTDWLDSEVLLWQQKYYWYIKHHGLLNFFNSIRQIDKELFSGLNLLECHHKFMQDISPEQKMMLLKLYNKPIPNEKDLASEIYLNSEDVLKLSSSGMEIGSHSCGHHFMNNLSDDIYFSEMSNSKKMLENLLQKNVTSFSYPFNSYRQDDEIIKKVGYRTCCTVDSQKFDNSTTLEKQPRFDAPSRKILFENSLRKIVYFKK